MAIRLEGVRVHNLCDLTVEIPHGRLTVITGVSGSGKSSLAFDTLYAEGQRRYVESLSTYARRFLERLDRPEVLRVEGIPPAVALSRRSPPTSARSTVGTVTEVHDYLRLLFARAGTLHCPGCRRPVQPESPSWIASHLVREAAGERLIVTFPVDAARAVRATGVEAFREGLLRDGFTRLWRGGRLRDLDDREALGRGRSPVEVVVDRVKTGPRARTRLSEALDTAYRYGQGRAVVRPADRPQSVHRFSEDLHCPHCDRSFRPLQPNLFSFNNPLGACPECRGFGRLIDLDPDKVVPDPDRSLKEGAIEPFTKPSYRECQRDLLRAARRAGIRVDRPYRRLSARERRFVWEGEGAWYGVRGLFEWLGTRTYKVHVRVLLARYRTYVPCPVCRGTRLVEEARAVELGGESIDRVAARAVGEVRAWLAGLKLPAALRRGCRPALKELGRRLEVLDAVGLGYLALDRLSRTLSGGEWQRVNLAACLGAGLTGTLYVLDEPTVGLHPLDAGRLLKVLLGLRDMGNTVVVVEHDLDTIRAADHVIDLGPGAGALGGRIVAQGAPSRVARSKGPTGRALRRRPPPLPDGETPDGPWLVLRGVRTHNLRGVDLQVPLGRIVAITGVSGSGKSSLVADTLVPALEQALGGPVRETGPHDGLEGVEHLDGLEVLDQTPIGRTPRSNPVTYVKAFDGIRRLYAALPAARALGLGPGHFSFNVAGGRCEACKGAGSVTQEMHFLADVTLTCEACGGRRYDPRVLEVRYRGRTIADLLQSTIAEARDLLAEAAPSTARRLAVLEETGLGYLCLGQPAPTLSGGEAQRLKLCSALVRRGSGHRLYVLDEPTVGLHPQDVDMLVKCLRRLVSQGHTVLVVEHDRAVLVACDWMVDLGPGAAGKGGRIIACGPPARVARASRSATGRALRSGRARRSR